MEIFVASALGKGRTALSAFDDALMKAGVANYNLLKLSSVIPAGAKVKLKKHVQPGREHGHKMYVVIAYQGAVAGETAWAGLGWVQISGGKGVFVEHEGRSRPEVRRLLEMSLNGLKKRRGWNGKNKMLMVGGKAGKDFLCSLVVAKYQVESWE